MRFMEAFLPSAINMCRGSMNDGRTRSLNLSKDKSLGKKVSKSLLGLILDFNLLCDPKYAHQSIQMLRG
jgi:hypothetical protein